MEEVQQYTLQSIIRFNPLTLRDLKQLVPEAEAHEIENATEELCKRGFIQHDSEDRDRDRFYDDETIHVNTNPFKIPDREQQSLTGNTTREKDVIKSKFPNEVLVDETISLELTKDQTELFERMRTDVSRTCGTMTQEEFMDWVLREARRMTEV